MYQYSDQRIVKGLNRYILATFRAMTKARRRRDDPKDYLWYGKTGAKLATALKDELLILLEIRKAGRIQ